ncbi:hypothetical protein MKEN_01118400 [Mycena kentingensis (nom. inval.)]|nr:hypothetical protein MKEN_01118400 [Mycena kentingensis (nom. inval.)]
MQREYQEKRMLELRVLSVSCPPRVLRTPLDKIFLHIHMLPEEGHKTPGVKVEMAPPGLRQTFALNPSSAVCYMSLYRKAPLAKPALIGRLPVILDLEPRDIDIAKAFDPPTGKQLQPFLQVTYQLSSRDPLPIVSLPRAPVERCRFFLLAIGIDQYKSASIPNLRGCANDAHAFKDLLSTQYRIPEAQIAVLTNAAATREAIIRRFQTHLIYNASIEPGDAMVVYFAGHGSRAPAPGSWPSSNGKVKTLVPYDEREKDGKGERVHGIPDRTLDRLVGRLAAEKGDNITLILDCGYASAPGATRGTDTTTALPETLDRHLFGMTLDPDGALDVVHPYMRSHVVLAATTCRQNQIARERLSGRPGGVYTEALLRELRACASVRITYEELVANLQLQLEDGQNPQCLGAGKVWYLFEGVGPERVASAGSGLSIRSYSVLEVDNAAASVRIDAGRLHGVAVGTRFRVVADADAKEDNKDNEEVEEETVLFVAVDVQPGSSTVKLLQIDYQPESIEFPERFRVVKVDEDASSLMRVAIEASPGMVTLTPADLTIPRRLPGYVVVAVVDEANLIIRRTAEDEFHVTQRDATHARHGLPPATIRLPLSALPHALDHIVRFHHHLGLAPTSPSALRGKVTLEMYPLVGELGSRVPDPQVGNLVRGGTACLALALDADSKYGFAICNTSPYALFAYLFYFDPAAFSIDTWYAPTGISIEPSLPPAGTAAEPKTTSITVGYGPAGGYAFQFVPPDDPSSVPSRGFLKLVVSTRYLDLRAMEQSEIMDVVVQEQPKVVIPDDGDVWDVLDVEVILSK